MSSFESDRITEMRMKKVALPNVEKYNILLWVVCIFYADLFKLNSYFILFEKKYYWKVNNFPYRKERLPKSFAFGKRTVT